MFVAWNLTSSQWSGSRGQFDDRESTGLCPRAPCVRCGFWKEDLRWIVRLLVLLRGTEGCQRRGGDEQDKAHHSVCRSWCAVQCLFRLWWAMATLILAPVEMPTCESSRIFTRASMGQYRFSMMNRDSTLAAIFASTAGRTSLSRRPLELAAPVLRSCARFLVCGFTSHAGEVRGCAASGGFLRQSVLRKGAKRRRLSAMIRWSRGEVSAQWHTIYNPFISTPAISLLRHVHLQSTIITVVFG